MTLQKNIPLYKHGVLSSLPFLIIASLIFSFHPKGGPIFLIPFLASILIFILVRKIRAAIISRHQGEFESFQEKINLLTKSIEEKQDISKTLPVKNERASFLFDISKSLIELIEPEEIFDSIIQILERLFPEADSILVFRFDKEEGFLSLIRSHKRKLDPIKEKKGSSLDKWVLHQNRSLLIDDIVKDFRFDHTKLIAYKERKAHSFVLSPLSIGRRSLGLVRIESQTKEAFSLDDSRFLRNICDLAAVVLERSILFRRTEELATKDSLTGLFMRSYFSEHLARELRRAQRHKKSLGLIMLDIDDFKTINDTYGHVVGDLVLIKLADILKKAVVKKEAIVSRFGGEEFTLLLSEADQGQVITCAESICKTVQGTSLVFRRKKIPFTISLGVAFYPNKAKDPADLIEEADRFLYQAKRQGKNRTCYSG